MKSRGIYKYWLKRVCDVSVLRSGCNIVCNSVNSMAQTPMVIRIIDVEWHVVSAVVHHCRDPSQRHFSSCIRSGLLSICSWPCMTKSVNSHRAMPMTMNKPPAKITASFLRMRVFGFDILGRTVWFSYVFIDASFIWDLFQWRNIMKIGSMMLFFA